MAYSSRVVANAILRKAKDAGARVTHMKLQKLVFYVHAWMLALHDEAAISEPVEAWPYGPVVDLLYHELKGYGSSPITGYLKELDHKTGKLVAFVPNPESQYLWSIIDQVWNLYGRYSATQLSAMTHKKGSPWDQAHSEGRNEIPNAVIAAHFKGALMKADG